MGRSANLPQIIRAARKTKGLTLDQVARHLGYSHRATVSRYETGGREPSIDDLIKLAVLLDLDLNELKPPVTIEKPIRERIDQ